MRVCKHCHKQETANNFFCGGNSSQSAGGHEWIEVTSETDALEIIKTIDKRMGEGWTKSLAEALKKTGAGK